MSNRSIEYLKPTSNAFDRMVNILFRPFDFVKWLTIGFTAWLAMLLEHGCSLGGNASGEGGGNFSNPGIVQGGDFQEMLADAELYIRENLDWIMSVGIIALVIVAIVIALAIVILWVSSRGKLMFLDNVVHNRGQVVQPWSEFKKQGNSLFWFRLFFSIFSVVAFAVLAGVPGYFLATTFDENNVRPEWIAGIVATVAGLALLGIFFAYVSMLLEAFVVPVMYKHSLMVTSAWRRVVSLHGTHFFSFILFALWFFLLTIGTGIVIILSVLVTCCIAGILYAIPYVGAVVLLPVSAFFRALGLEFLRQFGAEYDVWETAEGAPPLPPHTLQASY